MNSLFKHIKIARKFKLKSTYRTKRATTLNSLIRLGILKTRKKLTSTIRPKQVIMKQGSKRFQLKWMTLR